MTKFFMFSVGLALVSSLSYGAEVYISVIEDGTPKTMSAGTAVDAAISQKIEAKKKHVVLAPASGPVAPAAPVAATTETSETTEEETAMESAPAETVAEEIKEEIAPAKTQATAKSEYDVVPVERINELSLRMKYAHDILKRFNRAYDYKSMKLTQLKAALAELEKTEKK